VLTDDCGKTYIDFEAGVWCISVGHNHPGVNQAILNQLGRIVHVGYRYSTDAVSHAARDLLAVSPFEEGACVFLSSGSEAVEFGVRAIQSITQRPYQLKLDGFYLSAYGKTNEQQSCLSIDLGKDPLQELDKLPFEQISAFLFEPGNCSGQVLFPEQDLIHEIIRRTKEAGGTCLPMK
jgi:acetylornithine aminotransferase